MQCCFATGKRRLIFWTDSSFKQKESYHNLYFGICIFWNDIAFINILFHNICVTTRDLVFFIYCDVATFKNTLLLGVYS